MVTGRFIHGLVFRGDADDRTIKKKLSWLNYYIDNENMLASDVYHISELSRLNQPGTGDLKSNQVHRLEIFLNVAYRRILPENVVVKKGPAVTRNAVP